MPEEAIGDFVIAVNEVATNAVTHGHDHASMRTWTHDGDVVVEIHDDGSWKPGPMPGSVGGMGLWLARQSVDDLVAAPTEDSGQGCTVRLGVNR